MGLEKLPRDVALDIISRLPAPSLMQIKNVCRAWRDIAQDPRLPQIFHSRALQRDPSLILHCDCPIQNQLFYLGPDRKKTTRIDAELKFSMPEYQVIGSCNGLLCLSDALYLDPIRICNPFAANRDFIALPKSNLRGGSDSALGFGFHPISRQYKVVRVLCHYRARDIAGDEKTCVQILTVGRDESWRSLEKTHWRLDPGPSEALLNGVLHWVTTRYRNQPGFRLRIVSFDLAAERFREIELPACGSLGNCNFHLVVLGDCLSAVVNSPGGGIEVWVMSLYGAPESWTKDYVIGSFVPRNIGENVRPESVLWKYSSANRGAIQVVCLLRNGDILVEYGGRALVSYSPKTGEIKDDDDDVVRGLPNWFCTIVHLDTLFSAREIIS